MGCCSKKAVDVAGENYDAAKGRSVAPASTRKCRDCFCCIFFLVFWIGMIAVAIVGILNGEPKRLLYGTDYNGTTCGTGAREDLQLTFYPRMSQDLLEQAMDPTLSPTDYSFYGVCVATCPVVGSYFCNYEAEAEIQADTSLTSDAGREQERKRRSSILSFDDQQCWFVAMPSQTVFYRCIQMTQSNTTAVQTCVYPADTDEYYDVVDGTRVPNAKCQVKQVRTVSDATGPAQTNPLYNALQSGAAMVGRCIGDIQDTWPVILAFGGAVAVGLGFLFLILLKYCAGCFVWITLWGFVALLLLFALMLSTKGGIISTSDIDSLTESLESAGVVTAGDSGLEIPETLRASNDKKQVYAVAAYVFYALSGVAFLLVCFFQKKIRITVGIIKEASRVVQRMPLLVFFPIWPFLMMLALFIYAVIIAAFIYSSADIKLDEISDVVGQNATSAVLSKVNANDTMRILFAYHFFGFLWTSQLINAISMCTIAGAVSRYYWSRQKNRTEMGRFPIMYSFKNCFRYHFGSLAFGSFIIAVVQFIRAVLVYIDHQTQGVQESNVLIKIAMKIVQCCLWCLEKCLKFLSKNAYIMVAMKGKSFCKSAKDSLKIILSNIGQVGTVSMVTFLLLGAGKIAIALASTIIMFVYLEAHSDEYGIGGPHEISSPMAPILLTLLLAWFVASTFLEVYEMAIDTILLCFCEDKEMNKESGEYFMSDTLRKFVASVPRSADKERE